MTSRHSSAAAPTRQAARDDLAMFAVPPVPDGARGWRRLILGIDDTASGAFALSGQKLEPGGCYTAHHGALIVTVDTHPEHRNIRLLRVHPGGLAVVKEWRQKAALGARVVSAVRKHLPGAPAVTAAPVAGVPNRHPGACCLCGNALGVGQGRVTRLRNGTNRITHADQCPPAKTLPNERTGTCVECQKPVPASTGLVVRSWDHLTSTAHWSVRHATFDACTDAPWHLPNEWDDWCHICGGKVRAGAGLVVDQNVQHPENTCKPSPLPTWVIRRKLDERVSPGDTFRAAVKLRPSSRPVPDEAPGRTTLDLGMVSVIVTVIDTSLRDTNQVALVRAATWDEAAAHLADEVDLALDAQPNPRGFKAAFAAERIGDGPGSNPWLAEIVGHDPKYEYRRAFLPARRDYLDSNSKGTRGVMHRWVLSPNAVYEAYTPISWGKSRRFFLRVTADGGTEEITREQVDARLRHGLELAVTATEGED
jgi:hypothetical protein